MTKASYGGMLLAIALSVGGMVGAEVAQESPLAFEAASVRPSQPGSGLLGGTLAQMTIQPGRFTATSATLRDLIRRAYEVLDFQIVGDVPGWITEARFDVSAVAGGPPPPRPEILAMLRTLLEERFRLGLRREARELPVYTLTMLRPDGALGPRLRPTNVECQGPRADSAREIARPGDVPPCSSSMSSIGVMRANGQTIADLARTLTAMVGRIVSDESGLEGRYDWELEFDPEAIRQMNLAMGIPQFGGQFGPSAARPVEKPPITTAIQEQLGLKLEPDQGLVEVLVIEAAEHPMPD